MVKKCIFCGKPIEEKSKEHVIPQWLIEMTGDKNRMGSFGVDYYKILNNKFKSEQIKTRKYPFLNFTFPACIKCNGRYGSELESKAKIVLTKILSKQKINIDEVSTLLDWFDKVRIGLWLGYLYYNEQLEELKPRFYIDDRIKQKDRALFIYKCRENIEGINIVGPGGMLFSMIPSCFLLRINNYFFLNISKDALLLKDLGYPYPTIYSINSDGKTYYTTASGFETINQNLLSEYRIKETSKAVLQPIFKQFEHICQSEAPYIVNNSLEQDKGIGSIYIKEKDFRVMKGNEEYLLEPNEVYENLFGILTTLARRTSRILMKFANEIQNSIEESGQIDEEKNKMLTELHMAVTMEKLRMNHIKYELEDA